MTLEDQHTDRKSLRTVTGRTADWDDLARACVCFANGAGGRLQIGIEDGETDRPRGRWCRLSCWIDCANASRS